MADRPGGCAGAAPRAAAARRPVRLWSWTRHRDTVVELTPTRALLQKGRIPAEPMELEVFERNSPGGLPATTPVPPVRRMPADAVRACTWDQVAQLMGG